MESNQVKIALINSDDDPYILQDEFEFITTQLEPEHIKMRSGKHFIERNEFPELIEHIKQNYA